MTAPDDPGKDLLERPTGESGTMPAPRLPSAELEIKDAQLIFNQVWNQLEEERTRDRLQFPKEIMWLGGAPGAGKGTNTPFILRERGLTAPPIVMSDLLDGPDMQALKDRGELIGDREVIGLLLRELLKPIYESGVVVDGFPRTHVQAEAVKLLHDRMLELRAGYHMTPLGPRFRRPIFRITVLFVDEQTSIERQMARGREIQAHNERVVRTGAGRALDLRPTDVDPELARRRYRTFKDKTYEALTSLRKYFHYHFINAEAELEQVERNIIAEFQYQSSLELGHATYDIIHNIPVATEIIVHARQELVRRLDTYEHHHVELFKQVAQTIESDFAPAIRRHAIAGKAVLRTQDPLFGDAMAVDMVIDILSERGYHVSYEQVRQPIPTQIDLGSGHVSFMDRVIHVFEIRFHPPEIRRGH